MKQLRVTDFSSIRSATLDFNQVTLLVGPQASGKSVLCKLAYFFLGLIDDQLVAVSDRDTYAVFLDSTRKKFIRWFPLESWGDRKFELSFRAGSYEAKITRTEYKGKLGQKFRTHFSDDFKQLYDQLSQRAEKLAPTPSPRMPVQPVAIWDLRMGAEKLKAKLLGTDFVENQLFIPAGRSFFTSVGTAIAVFEQSSTLDPLTIAFGRLFRSQLEFMTRNRRISHRTLPSRLASDLLGGELAGTRGNEHIAMADGRKIPLALLSSGQQELLPLLTVMPTAAGVRKQLIYIEEPEAHTFPEAQSKLVQELVSLAASGKDRMSLVLTTHSPYVLAKFNNLIKAGQLGRGRHREQVSKLIPPSAWLGKDKVSAYAIRDGELSSIIDSEGLINGDYLDDVSGAIGVEFDKLLEIEIGAHEAA